MDMEMRNADLLDRMIQKIQELGALPKPQLEELKAAMRAEFGGEPGVCKKSPADRRALMREVFRRFNGQNATQLARELGIGRATVYRYLKVEGGER